MNSGLSFMSSRRSRFGSIKKTKAERFALKNGGEVGGLSNEGNTCFMNSVLQSLASSRELMKFIDSYLYEEILIEKVGEKDITMKSNKPKDDLVFTSALNTLFSKLNGSYGSRSKEFSTKPLLNKMPNGPKQNFFTGYNQEDAQEFYQLVIDLLENEYKKVHSPKGTSEKSKGTENQVKYLRSKDINKLISGCDKLGSLGNVYIPANQVDPNINEEDIYMPLNLITPVDGISVERIGCLTCGEVGGMRYSVNSGLSLNLPFSNSYYSNYSLYGLLDSWATPEIIEDVNCNRCGLIQTKDFLDEQINLSNIDKIKEQFKERLEKVQLELNKPYIKDEIFDKLTIKQMIRKTKKSKQILLSRPPPLLSIHINRSVFDPNTYRIAKNSSNVDFPAVLDLNRYVAEPNDINLDARKPFRKQDERNIEEDNTSTNISSSIESSPGSRNLSDQDDLDTSSESKDNSSYSTKNTDIEEVMTEHPQNPNLLYKLKAVISHFGTHNYGHYICYRKLRGTWWRISDETVYATTEEEVLNCQGTFMLFYEIDDGHIENLLDVEDEEEDNSSVHSIKSNFSTNGSDLSQSKEIPLATEIDVDAYESSGLSDHDQEGDRDEERNEVNQEDEFHLGEERAHL